MAYVYERPTRQVRAAYAEQLTEDGVISVQTLGRSMLSEPLDMYRIGEGRVPLLIVGAHHGCEWMSAALLYRFLFDLRDSAHTDVPCCGMRPSVLLSRYTYFVMPMLNTDGCELSLTNAPTPPLQTRQVRMSGGEGFLRWQANARGVDLNHNYAYGHSEYKRMEGKLGIEPGQALYSGEYPESEPESHALGDFVRTVAPRAVVSLHLGEGCVYYAPRTSEACRRTAQRIAARIGCTVRLPEGTAMYGGLCDYTGEQLGIPSFTLSVGGYKNPPDDAAAPRLYAGLFETFFSLPVAL